MSAAPVIPVEDKIAALRRELALRKKVYAKRVREGKMTPEEARWQYDIFESILGDYETWQASEADEAPAYSGDGSSSEIPILPTGRPDGAEVARAMWGGPEHNPPRRQESPAAEFYRTVAHGLGVRVKAFQAALEAATAAARKALPGDDAAADEAALDAVKAWVRAGDFEDPSAAVAHLDVFADEPVTDPEPAAFMATADAGQGANLFGDADGRHRDEG